MICCMMPISLYYLTVLGNISGACSNFGLHDRSTAQHAATLLFPGSVRSNGTCPAQKEKGGSSGARCL